MYQEVLPNTMTVTADSFYSYNLFFDDFKGMGHTVRRTTTQVVKVKVK
jgi:hypothetical protein